MSRRGQLNRKMDNQMDLGLFRVSKGVPRLRGPLIHPQKPGFHQCLRAPKTVTHNLWKPTISGQRESLVTPSPHLLEPESKHTDHFKLAIKFLLFLPTSYQKPLQGTIPTNAVLKELPPSYQNLLEYTIPGTETQEIRNAAPPPAIFSLIRRSAVSRSASADEL